MAPSRFLAPLLLVAVSACLQGCTDASSFDPARVQGEDLDHYVERVLAAQGVPGMSVAVVRGGEILLANGRHTLESAEDLAIGHICSPRCGSDQAQ